MTDLRVCLFGKYAISVNDDEVVRCDAGKVYELLCYLLFYHDRHHPRESLAGLFWGDCPGVQAKKYLRQALWHIQSLFDATHTPIEMLATDSEWVRIQPGIELWLDVRIFEAAYSNIRGIAGQALNDQQVQLLRSAIGLYQGDLLEGCYQDWCIYERERLQNMYLSMLDKLMIFSEAHNEFEAGLDYGTTILRYDCARERTHRQLMRLYYLAGDRTGALRQYQRCCHALEQELAVEPAAQTTALYHQICADSLQLPPIAAQPPNLELRNILENLDQLHRVLTHAQHTVLRDMEALRQATNQHR